MAQTCFGQPDDGIIQMAYVVEDISRAIDHWIRKMRVGPWFVLEHFIGVDPHYRRGPSKADITIAMAFAGHMNIELIATNNDEPSVYKEVIDTRGYGFHHWGIATRDFERDLALRRAAGHEVAFICGVPSGGQVAYLDTTKELPGFVELIEVGSESFDQVFGRFYRESIGWDGKDPVRSFI